MKTVRRRGLFCRWEAYPDDNHVFLFTSAGEAAASGCHGVTAERSRRSVVINDALLVSPSSSAAAGGNFQQKVLGKPAPISSPQTQSQSCHVLNN